MLQDSFDCSEECVIFMPDHTVKEVKCCLKNCFSVCSEDLTGKLIESDVWDSINSINNTETTKDMFNSYYPNVTDLNLSSEHFPINDIPEGLKQIPIDPPKNIKLISIKEKITCCYLCGKSFKSSKDLANHKYRVHPNNARKLFQCFVCDKRFLHNFDLNKHKKETHSGSNYKCDKCNKCFKTKFNLNRHLKTCT